MKADKDFDRLPTTFEIYASDKQKTDKELVERIREYFPEQVAFLDHFP